MRGRVRDCGTSVASLLILALTTTCAATVPSVAHAAEPSPVWAHQTGTANGDSSDSVAVGDDGAVYVVGMENDDEWSARAVVRKYGQSGRLIWTRTITRDAASYWSAATSVTVTSNMVVIGYSVRELITPTSASTTPYAAAYSLSGTLRWVTALREPENDNTFVRSMTAAPGGGVYVASNIAESTRRPHILLQRLSKTGTIYWGKELESGTGDWVHQVTAAANGDAVIVGQTKGNLKPFATNGKEDAVVARFRPSGKKRWLEQFGSNGNDRATSIVENSRGELIVAGRSFAGSAPKTMWARGMNARATTLWESTFVAPRISNDQFYVSNVLLRPDDSMLVVGSSAGRLPDAPTGSRGAMDIFFHSMDRNGSPLWSHMIGTSTNDNTSAAALVNEGRGVVVVGATKGNIGAEPLKGDWDGFVIAFRNTRNVARFTPVSPSASKDVRQSSSVGEGPTIEHVAGTLR